MNVWTWTAGVACALAGAGLYAGFVATELAEPCVEAIVGASLAITFSISFLLSGRRLGFLAIPALLLAAYVAYLVPAIAYAVDCPDCDFGRDNSRWPGILLPLTMFGLALIMAIASSISGTAARHLARPHHSRPAPR
jgi:hypothetical protein